MARAKRLEFTKPVQRDIIKRATGDDGRIRCEGCKCVVKPGGFQIDHIIADGLKRDKSKPLTAKDGQLFCSGFPESCHGKKTTKHDVPAIAKAKRREDRAIGVRGPEKRPIQSRGFVKAEKPEKPTIRTAPGPTEIGRRVGVRD